MDVNVKGFDSNQYTVEVGQDDTVENLKRKVAFAVGLPEDRFWMSFGGEAMGEQAGVTVLSAGDTVILTKTQKYVAIAELHALGETDLTINRLKSVRDPQVACLLLKAEVATVIPDDFLLRTSLTRLDISAKSIVTRIGDGFLADCISLTSIDLSGLNKVTHVGAYFLLNCRSLRSLDLSPFSSVTQLDRGFLSSCKGLTTVDLSPLSNVVSLGLNPVTSITHFAADCTSLTSIYLSGCSSVIWNEVRNGELNVLVVEARPKQSRDESPE